MEVGFLFLLKLITELCGHNLILTKQLCTYRMQSEETVRWAFWESVSCHREKKKKKSCPPITPRFHLYSSFTGSLQS